MCSPRLEHYPVLGHERVRPARRRHNRVKIHADYRQAHGRCTPVLFAVGADHACAVLDSGVTKCWGWNDYGQVIKGGDSMYLSPTTVDLGGTPVILSAGSKFTCAVLESNETKCWGVNGFGQIGMGLVRGSNFPGDSILPPTRVEGLGATPVLLSCGYHHACAVLESGAMKCWGEGENGQLGNGCPAREPTFPQKGGASSAGGTCLYCNVGCDRSATPTLADWAEAPAQSVDLGGTPIDRHCSWRVLLHMRHA